MSRAALIIVALLLAALCGVWQPFPPDLTNLAHANLAPGGAHLLGTDHLGRDMMSRLMAGAYNSAFVLIVAGGINVGVGITAGLAAGLGPRVLSAAIQQIAGFFIVMPNLVVALVVTGVTGVTPLSVALALGICGWAPYAILVLHRSREIRARNFVAAAQALGAGRAAIAYRHVLPNLLPSVLTFLSNQFGHILLSYAALSFLGLGGAVSRADWGAMIYEYRVFLFERPELIAWPAAALSLTCLFINLAADRSPARQPFRWDAPERRKRA
jgi:ABC-type dipeptide/oligopeptide/nickel transport system permease subunit